MRHFYQQVETFYDEVWNHKHVEKNVLQQIFSSDLSWFNPIGNQEGLEKVHASILEWIEGFPDCQVSEITLRKKENIIHSDWKGKATHHGLIYGIQPTGKKIDITGKSSFVFHENKIVHFSTNIDLTSLYPQLGVFLKKEDYLGEGFLNDNNAKILEKIQSLYSLLKSQEIGCLSLLLLGLNSKQIGSFLHYSSRTVEFRVRSGFMKLGCLNKKTFIRKLVSEKTYYLWHDLALSTLRAPDKQQKL